MADPMQKTPFVRELASSDRRTRDKALDSLSLYLRSRTDLSLLDLLKIWKGLFFCFFHSDRPLTQQSLARALSYTLVPSLPREILHRFFKAFWITMSRDWHSIDRLRLDKYMYLVRCYVGVGFEVFLKGKMYEEEGDENENGSNEGGEETDGKKRKRDPETDKNGESKGRKRSKTENGKSIKNSSSSEDSVPSKWFSLSSYLSILEQGPLYPLNFDPDEPKPSNPSGTAESDSDPMPHGPDGLRYHIMDIWLDELEKVVEIDQDKINNDDSSNGDGESGKKDNGVLRSKLKGDVPMDLLLRPMRKLKEKSPTKTVRVRAGEVLEDERLVEWGFKKPKRDSDDEDDEEDEDEWRGFD
ncbi:hypothetical protein VTN00DRAFT_9782 [Thermoascus crustaceus]|uniref:uncharacterized protein n=1 Tax=Thermoascus crustaceus TaxID=5088 RepID=UPI0037432048